MAPRLLKFAAEDRAAEPGLRDSESATGAL
jgi:hypothetical protein